MRIHTQLKTFALIPHLAREVPTTGYSLAIPVIKEKTIAFTKFNIRTYTSGISIEEEEESSKAGKVVDIDVSSAIEVPIKIIFELLKFKSIGKVEFKKNDKGKEKVLEEFLDDVYETSRRMIGSEPTSQPDMWLVYLRDKDILTRLVWIDEFRKPIELKVYGDILLLETENAVISDELLIDISSRPVPRLSAKKIEKVNYWYQLRDTFRMIQRKKALQLTEETIELLLSRTEKKLEEKEEEVKVESRGIETREREERVET